MTPPVLSPLMFRNGQTARNRVALAALTNCQSHEDGTVSEEERAWLEARARGGFGIVSTCAAHVSLDGKGFPGEMGFFDDKHLPGLTALASSLRKDGALSIAQLVHAGARSPTALTGLVPWGPSEITEAPRGFDPARAGTEEDILRAIGDFESAAVRAHEAGFQGVELHGAHGYLLTQFLSVVTNRRTDRWGGSFENRARMIREVTRAARKRLPADFLVGARISPEDFGQIKGLDLDESLTLAKWLVEDGLDFLHLSLWDTNLMCTKRPDTHPITAFREVLPRDLVLLVAGKIWTRTEAEALLERGADAVALGRSAICNPSWANDVADTKWEPRRPPLTAAELNARGLSDKFVAYMRRWKGFVEG